MKRYFFFFFIISLLISSCSKNILYISDIPSDEVIKIKKTDTLYRLQPYDYLYIDISTPDEKINELFKAFLHTNANINNNGLYSSYYLTGVMVNDSGYIMLPFIDTVRAIGLSVNELENVIQQRLNKLVNNAIVKVKLLNFEIFFLGEIQGKQIFYKDKVNILEAVSQAGGIPYTGDKKHVYVIRSQDSIYQIFTLNLTDSHILENKNFYLQPNDIIYIKPRRSQLFRLQVQDYYFLISLFTTTASLITLILTLKK